MTYMDAVPLSLSLSLFIYLYLYIHTLYVCKGLYTYCMYMFKHMCMYGLHPPRSEGLWGLRTQATAARKRRRGMSLELSFGKLPGKPVAHNWGPKRPHKHKDPTLGF